MVCFVKEMQDSQSGEFDTRVLLPFAYCGVNGTATYNNIRKGLVCCVLCQKIALSGNNVCLYTLGSKFVVAMKNLSVSEASSF
jgi:hypothetical protein